MFKQSRIGMYGGAEFFESADVTSLTTGTLVVTGADLAVVGTLADGATSISLDATGLTGTILKGQSFTVAGVKAVDIYGNAIAGDYAFVAQADATAAANAITVSIKAVSIIKPLANVSALPVAGAATTMVQDSNSSYQCGVIYDVNAFIHGNAKFAPISNMEQKEMKVAKALSVTTSKGADPINFKEIVRWDNLSSELVVRTNWASVVWYKA
jgi:hypothetical protein